MVSEYFRYEVSNNDNMPSSLIKVKLTKEEYDRMPSKNEINQEMKGGNK